MDSKNLSKIERDLNNLLRSPGGIKSNTLISIAKKLGRVLVGTAFHRRGRTAAAAGVARDRPGNSPAG